MRLFRIAPVSSFIISLVVLSFASVLPAQDVGVRTPNKNHLLQESYSFVLHGTYFDQPMARAGC